MTTQFAAVTSKARILQRFVVQSNARTSGSGRYYQTSSGFMTGGMALRSATTLTNATRSKMMAMNSSIRPIRVAMMDRTLASISTCAAADGNQRNSNSSSGSSSFAAGIVAVLAALTTGLAYQKTQEWKKKAQCSGLVAVVGSDNYDARGYLLEGLGILKNRGYDSAGLATLSPGEPITIVKFAAGGTASDANAAIELVRIHSEGVAHGPVGMAHTRWATHGSKSSDQNAHPLLDSSGKIAVVHNGTIHNVNPIRRKLQAAGHVFKSQTDSEVIAKLIGHYYKKHPEFGLKAATEKALSKCDGTWALVVMCQDTPDELVVACHGSPLVIGVTGSSGTIIGAPSFIEPVTFVASEVEAFKRYTNTFVALTDGEVGVVKAAGPILDKWSSVRYETTQTTPHDSDDDLHLQPTPDPHPNWTISEIYEQPEAIGRALCFGGRLADGKVQLGGLESKAERKHNLAETQHLVLSGVGTSLHAAQYGALLMRNLSTFTTVTALDASKCEAYDFPSGPNTACCVVSQSGETRDVARVLEAAQESNVPTFSVVNAVGSTIARTTKLGVYCHAGREHAVASTKSFMAEVTVMALLALWFRQLSPAKKCGTTDASVVNKAAEELQDALMRLPMTCGAALKTRDQCKAVAAKLAHTENCFVIGKGYAEPIAKQGAMKLVELGYLHAEGSGAGSLKHGSLALIEDVHTIQAKNSSGKKKKRVTQSKKIGTPVIVILLDDQHAQAVRNAAFEIKSRGGQVLVITDKLDLARDLDPHPIVIPSNGPLTALGAVIPLQLIAYELALLRGINPDTPRNLSKAVLVD